MGLLVEYTILEGKKDAQTDALITFIEGLKDMGDPGFTYTAWETDDPTRFIGLLEFDDEEAKQRFVNSEPFQQYRDTAGERFGAPPNATAIRRIGSTSDG
ncbi:MAG: hypothetical protein AAF362_20850 [Pseudomonadota bacterium]